MSSIEKGVGFRNVFGDFFRDVSLKSFMMGIVGVIFVMTFLLFFWAVLPSYKVEASLMNTWMTGCLYIMGLGSILLAAYYRKPMPMAGSFTGWICALGVATLYPEAEIFGACLASGVILVILAYTGWMKKILKFLPSPVVQGMIAGSFMSYGLYIVNPLAKEPLVVVLMVVAYLVTLKFTKKVPGVLAALVVAVVYYAIVGLKLPTFEIVARAPRFVLPQFTGNFPRLFISLTIPLTALVLGAENAQAYGVMETEKFEPPVNGMTLVSGIGGILSSLTGNINTNIAGPLTAMGSSPDCGKKEGRWTFAVIVGIGLLLIAPIYASLVGGITKFPTTFVYLITGLSVLAVLVGAFREAFLDNSHRLSAAFAFLVAASKISMFGLSAPFWALLIGDLVYILYEGGLKKKVVLAAEPAK